MSGFNVPNPMNRMTKLMGNYDNKNPMNSSIYKDFSKKHNDVLNGFSKELTDKDKNKMNGFLDDFNSDPFDDTQDESFPFTEQNKISDRKITSGKKPKQMLIVKRVKEDMKENEVIEGKVWDDEKQKLVDGKPSNVNEDDELFEDKFVKETLI